MFRVLSREFQQAHTWSLDLVGSVGVSSECFCFFCTDICDNVEVFITNANLVQESEEINAISYIFLSFIFSYYFSSFFFITLLHYIFFSMEYYDYNFITNITVIIKIISYH